MGNVKVSFGAFGDKALTRVFDTTELEGKSVKQVLEKMVRENWEGKDTVVVDGIRAEMGASGGYKVAKRTGGGNQQVKYEKISLDQPIRKYEETDGEQYPVVKFDVAGIHEVGFKWE